MLADILPTAKASRPDISNRQTTGSTVVIDWLDEPATAPTRPTRNIRDRIGRPEKIRRYIQRFADMGIELLLFKMAAGKEDVRQIGREIIEPLGSPKDADKGPCDRTATSAFIGEILEHEARSSWTPS